MPERRATMRDVARASGVSPATVSFVLNDAPEQTISPQTRAKVLEAAEQLGYRPHPIARALREGNSRLVVLTVGPLPRAPMLESFIGGLDDELAAAGHGLLVSFSGLGLRAGSAAVDAVNPRAIIDLPRLYERPGDGIDDGGWVDGMASHLHAQLAYLAGAGHRRIAIASPADPSPFERLLTGYSVTAAGRLGMLDPVLLTDGDTDALLRTTDAGADSVTAVAAQTDTVAFSVLSTLLDNGMRVPDQVAVIGLGDAQEAALWRPPLTTVRVDARSYGRRLARQVLGLPLGDAAPTPTHIIRRATA